MDATWSSYPKVASSELTHPEQTTLGRQFEGAVNRRAILMLWRRTPPTQS